MSRSLLSREKRWWSTWQGTESRKRCTNRATRVGSPQYNPCKPTRHLKRQKKVQNVQFDKWPGLLHILHSVWKSPKMSYLGFDRNLQLAKLTICIFSIFNELLSTQNVNVARSLARNVSKTFFVVFKHRDLTGPSKKKDPKIRLIWVEMHIVYMIRILEKIFFAQSKKIN